MPPSKKPITHRPKVEDESTGAPPREKHGKHREDDESLPGKGGTKGGLDRYGGVGRRRGARARHRSAPDPTVGRKRNRGRPQGRGRADEEERT